jgi:hypothetical protein
MPKYLVLYNASAGANEQMASVTPEQAQAGMELWMKWAGDAGDALVDLGSPLHQVATLGKDAGARDQAVGGFSIVEADSTDAVKALLDGHPHFHTPGDVSIDVFEFLPIPGS